MSPTKIDEPNAFNPSASKLMTVDILAHNSGVSKATIIKNRHRIKGYKQTLTDDYLFTPGTRYPFFLGFHKVETFADRMYVLLKALTKNKYISHEELRLEEYQFDYMLKCCLSEGYIQLNSSGNPDGANAYDITDAGSKFFEDLDKTKRSERAAKIDHAFKIAQNIKNLLSPFSDTSGNGGDTP
jgi:hypothetical protein